jgi:predicted XRE-type DNA-binding protein
VRTDNDEVKVLSAGVSSGMQAKQILAQKINVLVDARGLNQVEAAQVMRMPQPKVSAIRNGKLRGISLERLLQALADLGQRVDIVVKPSSPAMPAGNSRRSQASL